MDFYRSILAAFLVSLLNHHIVTIYADGSSQDTCSFDGTCSEDAPIEVLSIRDFGVDQKVEGSEEENTKTQKVIFSTIRYMRELRNTNPEAADLCRNLDELCAFWASDDECEKNSVFMKQSCGPCCQSCVEADNTENVEADDKFENEEEFKEEIFFNDAGCIDNKPSCRFWASIGECALNPEFMKKECVKSCELCESFIPIDKLLDEVQDYGKAQSITTDDGKEKEVVRAIKSSLRYMMGLLIRYPEEKLEHCQNLDENCAVWATKGECQNNFAFMKKNCCPICQNCGFKEDIEDGAKMGELQAIEQYGVKQLVTEENRSAIIPIIKDALQYMDRMRAKLPVEMYTECRNKDQSCAYWALTGECESNEAYMVQNCAPMCKLCDIDFEDEDESEDEEEYEFYEDEDEDEE